MSDSSDSESPTPRITGTWTIHEDYAHSVSDRLRIFAGSLGDAPRARRLREMSDLIETYARAFRRWSIVEVPLSEKLRERQAFSLVSQAAEVELG